MKSSRLAALAVAAALLSACASAPQTLYSWGNYPSAIYETLSTPEKADPQKQIKQLEADLQKARAKNQAVAPGFYAHLAYQYLQVGQTDKAAQYFALEKQTFPESAVYIDRLMKAVQ